MSDKAKEKTKEITLRNELAKYLIEQHPGLVRDDIRGAAKPGGVLREVDTKLTTELEAKLKLEDQARNPVVQVIKRGQEYAAYWGHRKLLLTPEEAGEAQYGILSIVADAPRFYTITQAVENHLHGDKTDPEYQRAVAVLTEGALDSLRCGDDATEFLTGISKIGSFTNHEDDDEDEE